MCSGVLENPGGRTQNHVPQHLAQHQGMPHGSGFADLECPELHIRWRFLEYFLSNSFFSFLFFFVGIINFIYLFFFK